MNMIAIAEFDKAVDAAFAKNILEGHDIPCLIIDELMAGLVLYSRAVGGVRLQVPEDFVEQAREILNRQPNPGLPLTAQNKDVCPNCQSEDVFRHKIPTLFVVLSVLLFLFPLMFVYPKWQCNACGHKWKVK